ncbi:hypothetical protein [Acinetobacter haemolyticus]|nr:hypothetical protein [Acinetobacter haemolyticus]
MALFGSIRVVNDCIGRLENPKDPAMQAKLVIHRTDGLLSPNVVFNDFISTIC